MQKRRFWILFSIAAAIGIAGGLQHPAYRERWIRRLPVGELTHDVPRRQDDVLWLYYAGLRLNEAGRYSEAAEILMRGAAIRPDEARLRAELARAQMALGQFRAAHKQLRQFADLHPESADAHLLLGKFYLSKKIAGRAREELERAGALAPDSAEAWGALASARTQFDLNGKGALDAAEKAVALNPNDAENLLQLAYLQAKRNLPEATATYRRALASAPERADAQRQFADYLLRHAKSEDDRAEAMLLAQSAIASEPDAPLGHLTLGLAFAAQRNFNAAIPPLEKAAALSPNDPRPASALASSYRSVGRTAEANRWRSAFVARQQFQSEQQSLYSDLTKKPKDTILLTKMARLLGQHGEISEALRYQGLALGVAADDPKAILATAQDLKAGGSPDKAAVLARRALETTDDPALREQAARLLPVSRLPP